MQERTKTCALYGSLFAAVVLAAVCAWLAVGVSTARERGELLRDALFSEARLADSVKKKGVLFDNVPDVEGSTPRNSRASSSATLKCWRSPRGTETTMDLEQVDEPQ